MYLNLLGRSFHMNFKECPSDVTLNGAPCQEHPPPPTQNNFDDEWSRQRNFKMSEMISLLIASVVM